MFTHRRASPFRFVALYPAIAVAVFSSSAQASTTIYATQDNIKQQIAALQPGGKLILQGVFRELTLRSRDFGGATIDSSQAHMAGGMSLRDVKNLNFVGGTYGSAVTPTRPTIRIDVIRSEHISFAGIEVLGIGDGKGIGMAVRNSSFITVRDSSFRRLRAGLAFAIATDSIAARNKFSEMGSDGINIASSYRVIASHNTCSNFAVTPGSHADCIQLWSALGQAVQSDIYLLNNTALGFMQGFTSFNSWAGGGLRFTFAGNYAAISAPQGIACGACNDSKFFDNVLIATEGARWRTSINIYNRTYNNRGFNNLEANNLLIDNRRGGREIPEIGSNWVDLVPSIAGRVGSQWDIRSHGLLPIGPSEAVTASVPEPSSWATLIIGLGVVGAARRRKRSSGVAC